jgi:hypothetical protein
VLNLSVFMNQDVALSHDPLPRDFRRHIRPRGSS